MGTGLSAEQLICVNKRIEIENHVLKLHGVPVMTTCPCSNENSLFGAVLSARQGVHVVLHCSGYQARVMLLDA